MYCEKCGRRLDGDPPGTCTGCGHQRAGTGGKGLSIASLVLSIIGLNTAAVITGVIALATRRPGRDMAMTGVIIAGARIVLGVLMAFLFAGLLMLGLLVAAVEQKDDDRPARRATSRVEELWNRHDTELSVDTTLAAQAGMFVADFDARLDRLEAQADSLILADPGDEALADAVRAVRLDIGMARNALARLGHADSPDETFELMARAERLHDRAAGTLERIEARAQVSTP